jgi:excisionase family DNA binding protein
MMEDENKARQSEGLWRIEDVAGYLHCSKRSVSRYVKDGLPHRRIGGKLLFRPEEVDAWVERQAA